MTQDSRTSNELDDQRLVLAQELMDWRDAGAPVDALVDAIEAFVDAKLSQRQRLPLVYPDGWACKYPRAVGTIAPQCTYPFCDCGPVEDVALAPKERA